MHCIFLALRSQSFSKSGLHRRFPDAPSWQSLKWHISVNGFNIKLIRKAFIYFEEKQKYCTCRNLHPSRPTAELRFEVEGGPTTWNREGLDRITTCLEGRLNSLKSLKPVRSPSRPFISDSISLEASLSMSSPFGWLNIFGLEDWNCFENKKPMGGNCWRCCCCSP